MTLERIVAFCLVAHDGEALARFYAALGFVLETVGPLPTAEAALLGLAGGGTRWSLRLGRSRLRIDQYAHPGRPYPADEDAAALCFQHFALVSDDVDAAWTHALAVGALPISCDGPVVLPASAGGVIAVKFRDPEGHPLELIRFPDRARPDWQGRGILGIDHSAIVVADADRSRAFYRGQGLTSSEATLNHGPTQVALDALADVQVDVMPMRPADQEPHIELLHYRMPHRDTGRPWTVEDVAATRIVWRGGAPALLRDPDGHILQVDHAEQA